MPHFTRHLARRIAWRRMVWAAFSHQTLPLLVLGVIAAAFFFALVLNAGPEVVFAIVALGIAAAIMESRSR